MNSVKIDKNIKKINVSLFFINFIIPFNNQRNVRKKSKKQVGEDFFCGK